MSLKRRVTNLEKNLPNRDESHVICWNEPGPLTTLASGNTTWTRQPDEAEDTFINRAMAAAGNVFCLWGAVA